MSLLITLGLQPFVPPPIVSIDTNNPAKADDLREHAHHQRGTDARLKIIRFLCDGPKTTREIMQMLGSTKTNAKYHLEILVDSGAVVATTKRCSKLNHWKINGA